MDDNATYSCNMGFELVGSSTVTCTQVDVNSAAFSPVPPVCRRKRCINVIGEATCLLRDIDVLEETLSFKSLSNFFSLINACTEMYVVGVYRHLFFCTALCPDPVDPVNGMVTFSGNSVDDNATYSCNMGFELVGSSTVTCTQVDVNSAAFSLVPPVCRRKRCINVIGEATCLLRDIDVLEETLSFKLLSNFSSLIKVCTEMYVVGVYRHLFFCTVLCPDPVDPVNGMVTFSGNSVDDNATYSCNMGFELVGSSTAMCTQVDANSAEFSPAPPVCRRKYCINTIGMPTCLLRDIDISKETLRFKLRSNLSSLINVCTQMYVVGVYRHLFFCTALCPDPVDPVNGMVTFSGNSVDDNATYSCNMGFELVGSSTAMCTQVDANSAEFSPAPPVCRRK